MAKDVKAGRGPKRDWTKPAISRLDFGAAEFGNTFAIPDTNVYNS